MKCDDVRSAYSAMTGDGESSGASSLREETSLGAAMGVSASLKMELARAKAALADRDYEFKKMQEQLEQLRAGYGMTEMGREVETGRNKQQKVGFASGEGDMEFDRDTSGTAAEKTQQVTSGSASRKASAEPQGP